MKHFDIVLKPFSTARVYTSLHFGEVVNGKFQSKWKVQKSNEQLLKALGKRISFEYDGVYGKASYTITVHLDIPEQYAHALAAWENPIPSLSGAKGGWDILYRPEKKEK